MQVLPDFSAERGLNLTMTLRNARHGATVGLLSDKLLLRLLLLLQVTSQVLNSSTKAVKVNESKVYQLQQCSTTAGSTATLHTVAGGTRERRKGGKGNATCFCSDIACALYAQAAA